jgi:beta-carotene hydroxylase
MLSMRSTQTKAATPAQLGLPGLRTLGTDLVTVGRPQRWTAVAQPFVLLGTSMIAAQQRQWWAFFALIGLAYPAFVGTTHDAIHDALNLGRWNQFWLVTLGLAIHPSATASWATHVEHHRAFPHEHDPESDFVRKGLFHTFLMGWYYGYRESVWTWKHHPSLRKALVAELVGRHLILLASLALIPVTAAPAIAMFSLAGWMVTFPMLAVYLVHDPDDPDPLGATHTAAGWFAPFISLGLYYHLEHHLYPKVPTVNYYRLARRLRPSLLAVGVEVGLRAPRHGTGAPRKYRTVATNTVTTATTAPIAPAATAAPTPELVPA